MIGDRYRCRGGGRRADFRGVDAEMASRRRGWHMRPNEIL